MEVEVASAGEGAVDHRLLEDDAADPAGGERLRADVEAGQPGGPAGRPDGGRQHPDGRRLACSVGAQEREHLAGGHVEVDALDRLDTAGVDLAELL